MRVVHSYTFFYHFTPPIVQITPNMNLFVNAFHASIHILHISYFPVQLNFLPHFPIHAHRLSSVFHLPTPKPTAILNPLHKTLHKSIPPIFLSTHSLASKIPLSVLTNKHSPGFPIPFTLPASLPLTNLPNPSASIQILFVGLLTMLILLKTGRLSQYFSPSHSLRVAMFSCVTGSGM